MYLLIILFLSVQVSWAQSGLDLCETMPDLMSCKSSTSRNQRARASRSSMKSIPSLASTAMMNPATVSFDKGFGIEMMYQQGNSLGIGLSSGAGRMGGALVSNGQENSFFGNHTYESSVDLEARLQNKKQFKTRKLGGAVGLSFVNERYVELDVGLMLKRHNELKKINTGLGVSGRLWIFTYGFAFYNDDTLIKANAENSAELGGSDLVLTYKVNTMTFGTKIGRMTFDVGMLKTKYSNDVESKIMLYSTSYSYKRLLFNYAYKIKKYIPFADPSMKTDKSMYGGLQISLGNNLITGINYNYFELDEFSLGLTIFF